MLRKGRGSCRKWWASRRYLLRLPTRAITPAFLRSRCFGRTGHVLRDSASAGTVQKRQLPTSPSTSSSFFLPLTSDYIHPRLIHHRHPTVKLTSPPKPTPPPKSIKMTGGKSGGKASGAKSSAQRYVFTDCSPSSPSISYDALFRFKTTRLLTLFLSGAN